MSDAIGKEAAQAGSESGLVEALILAIEQLTREQSIETITMPMITTRAGVSSASVYEYFPTKQALFAAWSERVWERALGAASARLQANVAEDLPLGAGVLAVVTALNHELRPYARAFAGRRFAPGFGSAARRAELVDLVTEISHAAFTSAPQVIAASQIEHPRIAARLVATLLCADTYVDLLNSPAKSDLIDAHVAKMLTIFISSS